VITFTVRTYDDIEKATDYDAMLKQHRSMLRYFAAMHAVGSSDVQAMLRTQDRKFGKWGRAWRAAAPLRKLAGACSDATTFLTLAKTRFQVLYGEDMSTRTRAKVDRGRTMEF
jgi:hypothetical protein